MKKIQNYIQEIDTDIDTLLETYEIEAEDFLNHKSSLISVKEARYRNQGWILIYISIIMYFITLFYLSSDLIFIQSMIFPFIGIGLGLNTLINKYKLKKNIKNGLFYQHLTLSKIQYYIPKKEVGIVLFTVGLFAENKSYEEIKDIIVYIKNMLMNKMYSPNLSIISNELTIDSLYQDMEKRGHFKKF